MSSACLSDYYFALWGGMLIICWLVGVGTLAIMLALKL